MSDFANWGKLLPVNLDRSITVSPSARIHDPVWLLSEQLQFGEFAHDGGATPIDVLIEAQVARPSLLRGDASGAATTEVLQRQLPLESAVEREPVPTDGAEGLRQRQEAGLRLQRMLRAAGLVAEAAAWATRVPFEQPRGVVLDEETRQWIDLMYQRVPDGRALTGRVGDVIDGRDRSYTPSPAELAVLRAWRQGHGVWTHAPGHHRNWDSERLEYRVSAAAKVGASEVVLKCPEHVESALDWFAFDVGGPSLGATGNSETRRFHRLPVPLEFSGMPGRRFWTFEDPSINFDALELVTRGDRDPSSAAMMVMEFAFSYGDDWYLVPMPVEPQAICDVTLVRITDCFGDEVDAHRPAGRWNLFRHDDAATPSGLSSVFFHAAPGQVHEGETLEEVHILRDEQANLAWAIETRVPHPLDEGRAPAQTVPPPVSPDGGLTWTLAPSTLPRHWFPLVPVASQVGRLQLGTLSTARGARPAGRMLADLLPAPQRTTRLVHEEEVPIEGIQITRRWQSTRAFDGSLHLWIGRAKRPRQTETAPGLRFDVVTR